MRLKIRTKLTKRREGNVIDDTENVYVFWAIYERIIFLTRRKNKKSWLDREAFTAFVLFSFCTHGSTAITYVAVCALFEEIHGDSNVCKDNGRAEANA